jgi:hypothetical protein
MSSSAKIKHERLAAREQEQMRRVKLRRRHAALAGRLLTVPPAEALALIRRARIDVDRWEREDLCSRHYITRWRKILAGPVRRVALSLLADDDWTDALLQNSPWSFAFNPIRR